MMTSHHRLEDNDNGQDRVSDQILTHVPQENTPRFKTCSHYSTRRKCTFPKRCLDRSENTNSESLS